MSKQPTATPTVTGIHHLKFPVSDLDSSLDWFSRAFGVEHLGRFDHRDDNGRLYATIIRFPEADVLAELRLAPEAAKALAGYDPVTFGVTDENALDGWIAHFDQHHIEHTSKVRGFIGQVIGVSTPDGLDIRLYTNPPGGLANATMDYDGADINNPELSSPLMSSDAQPAEEGNAP